MNSFGIHFLQWHQKSAQEQQQKTPFKATEEEVEDRQTDYDILDYGWEDQNEILYDIEG